MFASINEKYCQQAYFRNDIFRKFEAQFINCFVNNINIDKNLYVEQPTDEYEKALNIFFGNMNSDIKFFIGYTGVGKTTFLKHYFSSKTMGFGMYGNDAVLIPASWDGKKIPDNDYARAFDNQISNLLDNLIDFLHVSHEILIISESDEILEFINNTRSDIISSLTIREIKESEKFGYTLNQAKLQKSKDMNPVAFSSSVLKYVIAKHRPDIKRLIFILDDLETLAQHKLCYLLTTYLNIYDCMHNTEVKPIVNLLVSMRPHSFRFLSNNIEHKYINGYGNFLQNESYRVVKNDIPNIKEILISRFDDVFSKAEKPGNPGTWKIAKTKFYEIIDSLDDNIIKTISEICHLNIRAIIDCLHMILSNRVWCQNFADYSEYPTVRSNDYRFDIVNVLRTLACGESSVYTGKKDVKFNQDNLSNVLARPRFDDSDIFIPNILININTKECDIFAVILMHYLEGFFSSKTATPPHTEFISKKTLCNNLKEIFGDYVSTEKINEVIDYLFSNRIIRKSIVSKDTDNTLNQLLDDDYVYLTLKGSRLLTMFEKDSVLLEIYREDIKRNYDSEIYYKTSYELITENNRGLLFEDLVKLVEEIYYNEDSYQNHVITSKKSSFYELNFPISKFILKGVENSLQRAQNVETEEKARLSNRITQLKQTIKNREMEIQS